MSPIELFWTAKDMLVSPNCKSIQSLFYPFLPPSVGKGVQRAERFHSGSFPIFGFFARHPLNSCHHDGSDNSCHLLSMAWTGLRELSGPFFLLHTSCQELLWCQESHLSLHALQVINHMSNYSKKVISKTDFGSPLAPPSTTKTTTIFIGDLNKRRYIFSFRVFKKPMIFIKCIRFSI